MAYGQVSADVINTSVSGSSLGAGNASIMKNRIINGAMVIDQRNAGSSITANQSVNQWCPDRWQVDTDVSGKFTVQQNAGSVTPPVGFTNYLGVTSTSAYTVLSGGYQRFQQKIEGYNIADLQWGTSNAKTVTLSFWVYSSLTGTFGGAIQNSAQNRSYPYTYTISSANTWQQISITIAGDTTGTWLTTNGTGIAIQWGLGVGSTLSGTAGSWAATNYISATGATSVVGTNGATFYITGVQLEVGSSATGYEYRQYGQELALCQRYFWQIKGSDVQTSGYYACLANGWTNAAGSGTFCYGYLPVTMRTQPSLVTDGTGSHYAWYAGGTLYSCTGVPTMNTGNTTATAYNLNFPISGGSAGQCGVALLNGNTAYYIQFSAEL
jgi:hypothetical protein